MSIKHNHTIHQLFVEQVKKTPDNIAITCDDQNITYQELNTKSNQLAHYIRRQYEKLHKKPLAPDTLIAIYFQRNIEMMIAILAILKAGGAYVPFDPSYPQARIGYMMQNSQVTLLLTQEKFTEELDQFSNQSLLDADYIFVDADWQKISQESNENLPPIACANNLAYVIYTSGSTGNPKAVLIEHKGLVSLVTTTAPNIITNSTAKVSLLHSICFDFSVWVWAVSLSRGAQIILFTEQELPPYKEISKVLQEKQVTIVTLPPTLLELIPPTYNLPELKMIIVGGEKCPQKLVDAWAKNKLFINMYGPTETTIVSTMTFCQAGAAVTIGKAVANTELYILDEKLQPTSPGEIGELYIGGIGVARGYLNHPDLTKEKFISYKNSRVYKTGDLVRLLPDGNLEYVGRNDQQVKIRGYRIELGEIEDTLCKYKDITQCVVNVWSKNESEQVLVAYYATKNKQKLNPKKLREYLQQILPDYMLPAFFVFVTEFSLTANKKIDRQNLPLPYNSYEIENTNNFEVLSYSSEIERKIFEIWSKFLKLPANQFSNTDNFFVLGGDSLLITRVLVAIKKELNIDVPPTIFLANPTIANIVQNSKMSKKKPVLTNSGRNKLETDITIANTIIPSKNFNPNLYHPNNILLTGATGFLGVYLLNAILQKTSATIYCLVRAKNLDQATTKLKQNINKHKFTYLLDNPQVKIIVGDLEKTHLGMTQDDWDFLAKNVDSIYHCGAYVHHIYDYNKLFLANVQSTIELLHLTAQHKNKAFHYISTISSVSNFDDYGYATEDGPSDITPPKSLSGYALSKWVAERILWQAHKRGFNIAIYRPGNIMGDTNFGICHPEQNHLLLLIKSCIQLGVIPNFDDRFEAVPVDVLANAITTLSVQSQSNGRVFNLHHPCQPAWRQFIEWLKEYGFKLKSIAPEIWRQQLQHIDEQNALFPLLTYYLNSSNNELNEASKIRYHTTQKMLTEIGITYPKIDKEYIHKCIDYLVMSCFLG